MAAINGGVPRLAKQSREEFLRLVEEHQKTKTGKDKNAAADGNVAKKDRKQLFEVTEFQIGL